MAKGERQAAGREEVAAADRRLKSVSLEVGVGRRGGGGRESAQEEQGPGIEASTGGFETANASDRRRRSSDSEHRDSSERAREREGMVVKNG